MSSQKLGSLWHSSWVHHLWILWMGWLLGSVTRSPRFGWGWHSLTNGRVLARFCMCSEWLACSLHYIHYISSILIMHFFTVPYLNWHELAIHRVLLRDRPANGEFWAKDKKCSQARVDNMTATAEHAKLYGYQYLGEVLYLGLLMNAKVSEVKLWPIGSHSPVRQVSDHCALEIVWDWHRLHSKMLVCLQLESRLVVGCRAS